MTQVIGVIQDIRSRSTSVGEMYDIVVDGNTYGVGKYAPRGVARGDTVSFTAETRGNYKNVGKGTLRKVEAMEAPQAISGTAPLRALPPTDAERQGIISRQAALNTAVSFVSALTAAECVPLPARTADRLAYCNALVLAYANSFHVISTGKELGASPDSLDVAPAAVRKAKSNGRAAAEEAPTSDADLADDSDIPF